jgi:DNA-binding HxlR family transcriptional regulator
MEDCPVTKAWKILGKPWRIVIVSRLLEGNRTFNSLLWSLPGISTRTLSNVLKEFTGMGIIEPVSGQDGHGYRLTEKGEDLAAVVSKIKQWSEKWLEAPPMKVNQ